MPFISAKSSWPCISQPSTNERIGVIPFVQPAKTCNTSLVTPKPIPAAEMGPIAEDVLFDLGVDLSL